MCAPVPWLTSANIPQVNEIALWGSCWGVDPTCWHLSQFWKWWQVMMLERTRPLGSNLGAPGDLEVPCGSGKVKCSGVQRHGSRGL